MFRGTTPSDISPKHFGAGSIISVGKDENYLVVTRSGYGISLVRLETFTLIDGVIYVEDVNYLTEENARDLTRYIDENYTFSDFTCNAAGLKAWGMVPKGTNSRGPG